MAIFKLTSEIVDNVTKAYMSWDGVDGVSSDDVVGFIEGISPDDDEINIRINCCGGNVFEGWRIYDSLRQSGKKITATIEGLCASMATVIMMAAPKESRVSYPNSVFCIHNPEAGWIDTGGCPDRLTAENIDAMADRMKVQAEQLRVEQQKILEVYVDRTGTDAETLQKLMDENICISTSRAIELGLIDRTLVPNTASVSNILFKNNQSMNKNEAKVEVGQNWLTRLIAKAGFKSVDAVKFNDLTFTSADGNSFSVEREEGIYAIGDTASPDGKFVMEDGSTVCIESGVIKDIIPAKVELKNPETGDTISDEEAQLILNNQHEKIKQLEEDMKNAAYSANEDKASKDGQIATLNAKIDELQKSLISDEQRAMLDTIETAGGKTWFDAMCNMTSNGAPAIPQRTFKGDEERKMGDSFLDNQRTKSKRYR